MSGETKEAAGLTFLDRPNSYIGRSVPRPNARRLLEGRGTYVDDVPAARLAHVAFLRSPHAHARILSIDTADAKAMPGVIAVVTGAELATVCTPWIGVLGHFKGLRSAPQHALALDRVAWVGEPFCAVVAHSRAEAEDALGVVAVEFEPLPAVVDMETALDPGTPAIHADLGDNLAFERTLDVGEVEGALEGEVVAELGMDRRGGGDEGRLPVGHRRQGLGLHGADAHCVLGLRPAYGEDRAERRGP
ncbi:hypothetical protein VQ03_29990, partial [Methylobacterium tarhaniae]